MTTSDLPRPAEGEPMRDRRQSIATTGTVVLAITAASCCWLPLVLLALGISGTTAALLLDAYRPFFIAATLVFLGAAFYVTYRPRRAAATSAPDRSVGHADDAPEACCDADPVQTLDQRRSFDIVSFNKVMLWAVTLLAVTFIFFPHYVEALLGTPAPCCARGR